MLTEGFYRTMAALLKGDGPAGGLYLAAGGGDSSWDRNPPLVLRSVTRLANELTRKPVQPAHLSYLDAAGAISQTPTPRVRVRLRFEAGEATGTLREVGLFAQASGARNSGTLLSYLLHAPVEKAAAMSLERSLSFDLTPRAAGGVQPTRYLGNSHTREVHDTERLKAACQVNEILFDRRIYFVSPEQALGLGYDRCAYCFGRALSDR